MLWRGRPQFTCVLAFDKHNVIDEINEEESSRFLMLRDKVQYYNNLGGALALISRGFGHWEEVLARAWNQDGYTDKGELKPGRMPYSRYKSYTLFFQIADFLFLHEWLVEIPAETDL